MQYLLTLFSSKLHFVTVVCTMLKGSVYHQTLPYYCLIDSAIETSQQAFRAEEARAWGLGRGAILPCADTNTTKLIPCLYQISIVTLPSHNEPINSCGLKSTVTTFYVNVNHLIRRSIHIQRQDSNKSYFRSLYNNYPSFEMAQLIK